MISKEQFEKGVSAVDVKTPLDVLDETGMAMTTKEITESLQKKMPHAGVTYGATKQKMARYEKDGVVIRKRVEGKNYWLSVSKK